MTGMIVQKMAVENPSRVKSIIAITPIPACGTPGPKEIKDFFKAMAIDNDETAIEFINLLTSSRYTKAFARDMIAEVRQNSSSQARVGYMNMFFDTDFSESVKGLPIPILVLFGEYDSGILNESLMRDTFLKWYPNSQLECCKGSGHYPMIETPLTLVASVERFLSDHSSPCGEKKI